MKYPEKYLLTGAQPDGTTVCTCEFCKRQFAIPNEEVQSMTAHMCESQACAEAANKLAVEETKNLMKANTSDDVKTALGN